jgi:Ca2+-binding RTX toxin-like protein
MRRPSSIKARRSGFVLVSAFAALALAAPTNAAADPAVGIDGATFTFVGDSVRNEVELSERLGYIFLSSTTPDAEGKDIRQPITVSPPCDHTVYDTGPDPTSARCPGDLVASFSLSLAEGDDWTVDTCARDSGRFEVRAGPGADEVNGCSGDDAIFGEEGDDFPASGGNGDDIVDGGSGNDEVLGCPGNDRVFGGSGDDAVDGDGKCGTPGLEPGDDLIDTGEGNDEVTDLMGGKDVIKTGSGRDRVNATDGVSGDKIQCGPGRDSAVIDPKGDKAGKSCEKVKREKD